MEEVSGKNFDLFFNQWVYSVGHPKLEIEPVILTENKISIKSFANSKRRQNPDVFIFPLDIFIQTENGEKIETSRLIKKHKNFLSISTENRENYT